MDFIIGLPPSLYMDTACDVVMVLVDRFLKMVRYVTCLVNINIAALAEKLIDKIFLKVRAL